MYLKTIVLIAIAVAMFIMGLVSGYLYTVSAISTKTVTETIYRTFTSMYTTTIVTSSIYTYVEKTTLTTTHMITETLVETVTRTVTPYTQIVLQYPLSSWASVDFNNDGQTDVVVEINPWNMRSARGEQRIVVNIVSKSIEVYVDLTDVTPVEWINGYPEIIIGRKPWHTSYANGFKVPFPMKVRDATPFITSFYICLQDLHPSMNFNIVADAWIVRESIARTLGRAPSSGDLEIMVWLFDQNLNPAGGKVGEVTIPIVLNGTIVNAIFEVWRMESVPWGGWQYIAFKSKGWKHTCGQVAYNPTDFVKAATKFATFDISDHYLLGWEVGTEWGTRTSKGIAKFSWILRDFVVVPGASIQRT